MIINTINNGIRLIVGPTGSGKNTTVATVLKNLYQQYEGKRHILSVEVLPEFRPSGVNQVDRTRELKSGQ